MSQTIPWLPQYELNLSDVDHQPRELFRMLNDLMDATWDGTGQESLQEALEFMANYTVSHFATEEHYMRTYEFPGYAEHKQAHDDLTAEVLAFIGQYSTQGVSTELLVSVILKLGNWTRDHIRDMDKQMGLFILAKRASSTMLPLTDERLGAAIAASM